MNKVMKISIFLILYGIPLIFVRVLPAAHLVVAYTIFTICLAIINFGDFISFFANFKYAQGNGSESLYKLAILKDTTSPTAYLNYAILLMKNQDYEGALPHLKNARALNTQIQTDKNIMITLSSCYKGLGDIDNAIDTLTEFREKYNYLIPEAQESLDNLYILKKEKIEKIEGEQT